MASPTRRQSLGASPTITASDSLSASRVISPSISQTATVTGDGSRPFFSSPSVTLIYSLSSSQTVTIQFTTSSQLSTISTNRSLDIATARTFADDSIDSSFSPGRMGAIIGGTLAGTLALVGCVGAAVFYFRRRRGNLASHSPPSTGGAGLDDSLVFSAINVMHSRRGTVNSTPASIQHVGKHNSLVLSASASHDNDDAHQFSFKNPLRRGD